MAEKKLLEYRPFVSCINNSFWHKLTQLKLDVDRLDESEKHIWGYFSNVNVLTSPILEVDSTSYNSEFEIRSAHPFVGRILNKNTVEQFKECNKTEIIEQEGCRIWAAIESGACLEDPTLLNAFFILTFADLKKYHYYYWFAFPTPAKISAQLNSTTSLAEKFNDDKLAEILAAYNKLSPKDKSFFLLQKDDLKIERLAALKDKTSVDYYFAYADPCSDCDNAGWPIRNYILLLQRHCPAIIGANVDFLAIRLGRDENGVPIINKSNIFNITVSNTCKDVKDGGWIGWERNERGKLGPKMANMKSSMDPKCLAETSVDLNLKLMKWRLLPNINLDLVKATKCLLLGAGTLGCSVARVLMGWGVRHIDFVDNSTVSYSNPVRQSLFNYEDCLKNKPKAEAAADNLQKIFPGIISKGYQFSIPMPGHSVGESMLVQTKQSVEKLTELIKACDIVFLLMDSRESRWLPTVLGAYHKKVVINAALGFDTYLVMRHGVKSDEHVELKPVEGMKMVAGRDLGCYFCNDVTAPGDSLKDRTLDQQCTVTRPGVSQIAGALAVELAISLLQHEHRGLAPAFYKTNSSAAQDLDAEDECLLGILPHSIRGFLSSFSHVLPATERYKQCIACSEPVLKAYADDGFEFLLKVFDTSKHLEDVTGLSEMYTMDAPEVWDFDSEEDED